MNLESEIFKILAVDKARELKKMARPRGPPRKHPGVRTTRARFIFNISNLIYG